MDPVTAEYLRLGIAFLSGGLAGAVFDYFVSRRREQVGLALKIMDKYLAEFGEIGECKTILADSTKLAPVANQNKVRRIGDWFELISILYQSDYLSKTFLDKVGLLAELRKFHELVTQRKNEPQSPLNDAWLAWPHLDAVIRSK